MLRKILRKLSVWIRPRGAFGRNVALLAGGTALGQGLLVLASPLLTRLYSPADFGTFAVYVSILSMLVIVASLRYELAIPLPKNETAAANLLMLSLIIVLFVTLLAGLGTWMMYDLIVQGTNTPMLGPYLWLLPLGLAAAGSYQVLNYWAIRHQRFGSLAQTNVIQNLIQAVTQLGLGLLKIGPLGLLLGDVIGRASSSSMLALLVWQRTQLTLGKVSISSLREVGFRYRRFPLFSSVSALLNSGGWALPALLLAAFYGPHIAGLFAITQRVMVVPSTLATRSVAQVYFGEASRLVSENPTALRGFFLTTARRLFAVGIVPIGLVVLAGPWLFGLVFGDDWREAGTFAQILAPMFLATFVVGPLSHTLNILEHQRWLLAWDAGQVFLVVGGLWLSSAVGWPAQQALISYGVVVFVAQVALFILSIVAISRFSGSNA